MMVVEGLWQTLDRLVDVHCIASMHGRDLPSAKEEILSCYRDVIRSPKTIDDFNSLSDADLPAHDFLQQKISWITQRITGARSWSVGTKILHTRRNLAHSPIVDQIRTVISDASQLSLSEISDRWDRRRSEATERIDCVALDVSKKQVVLGMGVTFSQAKQKSNIQSVEYAPLFLPPDQIVCGVEAPAAKINAQLRARELVQACLPEWSVTLLLFVINDGLSWTFQCHDMTELPDNFVAAKSIALDEFPLFSTTRQFTTELRSNPDLFTSVGNPPPYKKLSDAIHACPVYRYTRATMLLLEMWEAQREEPSGLVTLRAKELEGRVKARYGISYTIDARRHDLEDCLRAGNYLRRARQHQNAYGLTGRGIARVMAMIHKYNPMCPTEGEYLLLRSLKQEMFWRSYQGPRSF